MLDSDSLVKSDNDDDQTPIINSMLEETRSNNNSPMYNNHLNPGTSVPAFPENSEMQIDNDENLDQSLFNGQMGFMNPLESVLSEVIRLEYSCPEAATQPMSSCDIKDLNDNEFGKLTELRAASESLFYPLDDEFSNLSDDVDDKGYKVSSLFF